MKIGYVPVSKQEQNEALQIDALKEAGYENIHLLAYNEKATVPRAVTYLRPGLMRQGT